MCGLLGFSGKKNFDINKIKLLFLYNEDRGKHSTGVYTPTLGEIIKDSKKSSEWLTTNTFDEDKLLIGHTRHATKGAVNTQNAHPFKYGTTIGAHNGTLTNPWDLCRNNKLAPNDYDVDSQVLVKLLDHHKDPRVLYDFEGAAAVIFTNEVENSNNSNTLYVFRNNERPLFYGKTPEGIYLSSLKESLETIEATDIEDFKINTLYKIVDGVIKGKIEIPRDEKDEDEDEDDLADRWGGACANNNFNHSARGNTNNSSYSKIRDKFPVGCYVELNPENASVKDGRQKKLKVGQFYLIKKVDQFNRLIIDYKEGEEDWFSPMLFNDPLVLKPDTFALCVEDLTSNKTDEDICDAGDYVYIKTVSYDRGDVDFATKKGNKVYIAPVNFLRALKIEEIPASFDFMGGTADIKNAKDETEEDVTEEGFSYALAGKVVEGELVDSYLEHLGDDLNELQTFLKDSLSSGSKGYLNIQERKKMDKLFSDITTGMYEFVYEAGGHDSDDDDDDVDNPAETENKKETCPINYPAPAD